MHTDARYDLAPGRHEDPLQHMIIVADPGPARARAQQAVLAARGAIAAELDWRGLPESLGPQPLVGTILVDAEDVADDLLATMLPRIDTFARATDARVVVALASGQIDPVTAVLFGPHVQLLCEATLAELVAALVLTRGTPGRVMEDAGNEGEAARLQKLSDEVARIAETLAQLTRPTPRRGAAADRSAGYGIEPATADATPVAAGDVRAAIRSRRLRNQAFGPGWFEDPAWDILLDLYAAELEGTQVSVSSLCIAAAVASTTALRWIAKMSEARLLGRQPDPLDRRRAFMTLTEQSRAAMRLYCTLVKRAGLAIA